MQAVDLPELKVSAYSITSCLGVGSADSFQGILDGHSALAPVGNSLGIDFSCYLGVVDEVEDCHLPCNLRHYDCRNNRLAHITLEADGFADKARCAVERYGSHRVGLFVGTSTSGIAATENAYANRQSDGQLPAYNLHCTHSLGSLLEFVAESLGISGPAQTISTACSSSAKVFAAAQRHIACGLCDAAVVGGVDSICLTTLYGFNSLQLISSLPARPWGRSRDGISIGEGGGFALLERVQSGDKGVRLKGCGESSDAYHMSSPHPQGEGAFIAINSALRAARCAPEQIDYLNLHGTGTPSNDKAEDRAVTRVFGGSPWCSSTKGNIGHTLGAAGVIEALLCCMALENSAVIGGVTEADLDPELATSKRFVTHTKEMAIDHVASLSLGFGGSNCCLIFKGI
ncbi:beta-ketoacyl-ACP synthase [Halorhodospira halochloris]|uniref:beta-ketoacyl-ACP synthase n=1 Tax=Halorhodospira halochloris TaxID=1052 RepID=UPI001EE87810|nr:beta-ketoacyl-ACP synthase [Halorhodospira halochloris]MCG5529939.1 beta-ketoacyl-ACP synthase [Halorhodospira halochloris]